MLSLTRFIRNVSFGFARKIKSQKESSQLINADLQNQFIHPIQKSSQTTVEQLKQLSEEFQSLSSAKIDLVKQKQKQKIVKQLAYEGEDPSPNKLVNRPAKGVVWGLGGQLVMAQRKVELQGVRDDAEQISKFLQLHQVKNIYVHDWKINQQENSNNNRKRYSIIGSCFSARHCWKTAIELKNAFNKHMLHKKRSKSKKIDLITALMVGKKDDQWTMVQYKDFSVSLMTQQQREAMDLQWKWNNPVSQQVVQKHARLDMDKKRRKGKFQDLD